MKRSKYPSGGLAALGMIGVGAVIAFSSLTVVRAERMQPDGSKSFKCSSGNACVQAISNGSYTYGLSATSTKYAAIIGSATVGQGVWGKSSGPNISSEGVTGVASGGGYGVYGESDGSSALAAVFGNSSNGGPGILGASKTGTGVYGAGGTASSTDSYGVEGISNSNSPGVFGTSASTGPGVTGLASSPYSYGVYGYNLGNAGVYGIGLAGVDGESSITFGYGVLAQADSQYTYPFYAVDFVTGGYCFVDPDGNYYCSGTITGTSLRTKHRNSNGQRVLTYASESASATVEDVGSARMLDGLANVEIPSDFASVMDRNSDYYVFLTPLGDTRGLYVSIKTPGGFQVRETLRGRSNLAFDYRIVARPIDSDGQRLPRAPRIRRPHLRPPPQRPVVQAPKLQIPNIH